MQDRELYRRILGIEAPWYVERVELKLAEGEVHVYLEHEDVEEWACGECGAEAKPYDHQAERGWRHLDTCQYQTILHARPPRAECPEHGVRVVKLPWAEGSSRFTALFGYGYERPARKHFRWWHNWAVRSRLKPMIEVGRLLKRGFENVITYLRHRVTNAASESINAKIQWVKYTARGFRNKQNFANAIYFHCGGLDLAPDSTK